MDTHWSLAREFTALALVFLCCLVGCAWAPNRPSAIPDDATPVSLPKWTCWQRCWHPTNSSDIECAIYSEQGDLLHKGAFIPYYPLSAEDESKLEISEWPRLPLHRLVWLKSGNVLMPVEDEAWARENVRELMSKRQ